MKNNNKQNNNITATTLTINIASSSRPNYAMSQRIVLNELSAWFCRTNIVLAF